MINYIFASSAGFLLNSDPITFNQIVNAPWFFLTLIIGTIFVLTFYLTAISMQRAGVSVTIVAARMSVIIPMVFSMLAYNEHINIYKILGTLPLEYREALILRYRQDLPVKEVAAGLGISVSGAKMRIHRGLEQLRHKLRK